MDRERLSTALGALWGMSEELDRLGSPYGSEQREWIQEVLSCINELVWPVPGATGVSDGTTEHAARGIGPAIDIPARQGSTVVAAHDGEVVFAGPKGDAGTTVQVENEHYRTQYSHLDGIEVFTFDHVKAGESIGMVGMTGLTTGPHLHFVVWEDGERVRPEGYDYSY